MASVKQIIATLALSVATIPIFCSPNEIILADAENALYEATPPDTVQEMMKPQSKDESAVEEEPVNRLYLGEFVLTAYCPCENCCGQYGVNRPVDENGDIIVYGAYGQRLEAGVSIATDPNVIDFDRSVEINGKIYRAHDTGGTINGNKIDIYMGNHDEAVEFGVQYADVYLIGRFHKFNEMKGIQK